MFGKKKAEASPKAYDRERYEPVIRCSICTGEQVAGFRERRTGQFHEVMLLREARDLETFRRTYGVGETIPKIY